MTGIVFDIQRGAFHDGPGVRTTVFLKGCPLRCRWCHNPESWSPRPQNAAPARPGGPPVVYGREMTVEDVMRVVRRDRAFYTSQDAGGGLTISGGEPTAQWDFCRDLLQAASAEGIHTCLDTCGHGPEERFAALAPLVGLFLWDIKATDTAAAPRLHEALTGVPAAPILRNFRRLYADGAAILLRCPLVPGVNDTPAHLEAIARFACDYPRLAGVEVLPWHPAGLGKFDRLGIPRPALDTRVPDEKTKAAWRDFFQSRGERGIVIL
jgi:pyruvate formate lyase activating enzyme